MTENEFKKAFDNFSNTNTFNEKDWEKAISDWKVYHDDIISDEGLPLDKWMKHNDGYLPDFLDTKERYFGHARIGNYDHVMIYKHRNGKYIDKYNDKNYEYNDNVKELGFLKELEDSYKDNIQALLNTIVSANNVDNIYTIEKSKEYQKFTCKQILRKITILCSLMDNSPYKHEFAWFFNDTTLENLVKILEIDVKKEATFLETNHAIYEQAKKYAGLDENSKDEAYYNLNYFLLFLSDKSFNVTEFSDFRNNNLIFNGAPGTGKTYGVLKGIEKLQTIDSNKYKELKYVQFHPAFSYQDFIEGIKPIGITDSGNVNLEVVNGVFKAFCIFVKKENETYYNNKYTKNGKELDASDPSNFSEWPHYYFVVDEINRGNLSNIFGETFTLLETDYRDYDFSGEYSQVGSNLVLTSLSNVVATTQNENLIYKKINNAAYFGIPFNIHFIGIMNDVDKSIDAFDLALRRRFKWISKYCDYDVIENILVSDGFNNDAAKEYVQSCKKLNDFICGPGEGLNLGKTYEIGHAFFLKIRYTGDNKKTITYKKKEEVFESYIVGTLKEYIRLVAEENEIDTWVKKAKAAFC